MPEEEEGRRVKKTFLNNFPLKILSVVCAIILWLVVMNISDYTMTVEIDDIPVTKLNGDVLDELDQVYDVEKGDTVDIIVKGRRSVVTQLSASDFMATADLSSMSITNAVQINVEPVDQSLKNDISITCVDNVMKLILEDKVSMQFPVYINVQGNPSDDYAVCETVASPNIVTVEGPKSAVNKIVSVETTISVSDKNSEFNSAGDIKLYDAYGEVISNDKITINHDTVDISVKIYPKKTVNVNVDVKGKPEDGYAIAEVQYQPQTVVIAGPQEDVDKIDSIDINDISVSGMNEDLQTTINLNKYLPDGVIVADTSGDVVVNVAIEKMEEKTITLATKDITFNNKQDGYTYTLSLSEGYGVNVSGLSHIIEGIEVKDLNPSIDCTGLSVGEHTVTITLTDIEGVEYSFKGNAVIDVQKGK